MSKTTVLAPLNRNFERRVQRLATEGTEIVSAYNDLTSRMLKFAEAFKEATDEAKRLDKDGDGVHAQYLRDTLADALQTTDASAWSKWNTIGSYAPLLIQHAQSLPPQRDSLYELALAVSEKKPVSKWIEKEKITIDSSVRDLRALRKTRARTKHSHRGRHHNAVVALFFKSYDEAVETLSLLIETNDSFEMKAHHAFSEALKSQVGNEAFEKIKNRLR